MIGLRQLLEMKLRSDLSTFIHRAFHTATRHRAGRLGSAGEDPLAH